MLSVLDLESASFLCRPFDSLPTFSSLQTPDSTIWLHNLSMDIKCKRLWLASSDT